MITQVEIARICHLDVSSVNKILNGVTKAKFHNDTIKRVKSVARRMGWKPARPTKINLNRAVLLLLEHIKHDPNCSDCKAARALLDPNFIPPKPMPCIYCKEPGDGKGPRCSYCGGQ